MTDDLKFHEIRGEESRTYHFPDGKTFTVEGVTGVHVTHRGNHRLEAKGAKWIVAPGWTAIQIKAAHWSL